MHSCQGGRRTKLEKLIWNFACRFIGMCAGCPLHARLILNTGSKLGQKEVLFFRTMEKTCPSSFVYGGKQDRIVLNMLLYHH